MADISVVLPTIDGREEAAERAEDSFPQDCEVVICRSYQTCGAAWVAGAEQATGDFICFAADDHEVHPGFCEAMVEAAERDKHPAALVLMPDGSKQSCGGVGTDVCRGQCEDWQPVEWSPTPFIKRDWWEFIEPHADMLAQLHYSTDCLVSAVLAKHGIPSVFRKEAVITHHNAEPGRLNTAGSDAWSFHEYRTAHAL